MEGNPYPVFTRLPADAGAPPSAWLGHEDEESLLDLEGASSASEFLGLGATAMSVDGRVLAVTLDYSGREQYQLRTIDVVTHTELDEPAENVARGIAWAGPDTVLYVHIDKTGRPYRLMRHRLGTDTVHDDVLYTEPDEAFRLAVKESRDRQWVLVTSTSKSCSETRIARVTDLDRGFRIVAPRHPEVKYVVEVAGDRLLVLHNLNGPEGTIAQAPLHATQSPQWADVMPYAKNVQIDRIDAYRGHVMAALTRAGRPAVHIFGRSVAGDIGTGIDVEFSEELIEISTAPGPGFGDDNIRISYSSLTTPPTIYDYSMTSRTLTSIKQMPICDVADGRSFSTDDYIEYRDWAESDDGERIPISIVARKDTPRHGTAPAILYGYGAYGTSTPTSFDLLRISALDRGVIFAIAHVRGGGEMGESWHRAGMKAEKSTSFTDFLACAKRLATGSFADPKRIAAQGSSAGGLLVAAAATMEPDVFCAVHADVPFVDPLTTELDPSLPLTVSDWQEWGDPLHDADAYATIKDYSPVENVRDTKYPAILVTTSVNDQRVSHGEGAKWIAELRERSKTDARDLLLKTQVSAGHGGASRRFDQWSDTAFSLAWLMTKLGISPGQDHETVPDNEAGADRTTAEQ